MLISDKGLKEHLYQLFAEKGVSNYFQTVDLIVDSELRGIHTHGLMLLPGLFSAIESGKIIPDNNPFIFYEDNGIVNVDCNKGFGVNAGNYACNLIKNKKASIVLIQNMNHWGRANYFISKIINKDTLCLGFVLTCPVMKFLSSSELAIGNNVFSCGILSSNLRPLIIDFCTSKLSIGKILENIILDHKIDSPIGYDRKGKMTHDAQKVLQEGLVLPCAEKKGDAIALLITLFISLFAKQFDFSNIFIAKKREIKRASDTSDAALLLTININHFPGFQSISKILEFLEKKLKNEKIPIYLPGMHSKQILKNNKKNGIIIPDRLIYFLKEQGINF